VGEGSGEGVGVGAGVFVGVSVADGAGSVGVLASSVGRNAISVHPRNSVLKPAIKNTRKRMSLT
jgi:hypothetical protein